MFKRKLLMSLPPGVTSFLWGARKTGKSTFLHSLFPTSAYFDLLDRDLVFDLTRHGHRLAELIEALPLEQQKIPIIIDEVQKVPSILDDIHALIENRHLSFILCGSSARKLKKGQANLLGGRAWKYAMFPLCMPEIPNFDLKCALNNGLLPQHYQSDFAHKYLNSYLNDYLAEEIQAEALVRNVPSFARFLNALSYSHGQLINYAAIAKDCGVDSKTVKEYFQILLDTLIGIEVHPYIISTRRDIIGKASKFYLFDVGVAGALKKRVINVLKGAEAGEAFEHFILMELKAYLGYNEINEDICFWRTKSGMELDFIIGKELLAIEVKISNNISKDDIKGACAFLESHTTSTVWLVCQETKERIIHPLGMEKKSIHVCPWQLFLEKLWNNELINNKSN